MTDRPTVEIRWSLNRETPAAGLRGVDSESVEVDDLVAWAKRTRRTLKAAIKQGWRDVEAAERREALMSERAARCWCGSERGERVPADADGLGCLADINHASGPTSCPQQPYTAPPLGVACASESSCQNEGVESRTRTEEPS